MFDKIKKYIKRLEERQKNHIDSRKFNDEIASLTEWQPLKVASANFNVFKLVSTDPELLQYKSTIGVKVFASIFIFAGLAFFGAYLTSKSEFLMEDTVPLVICLFFAALGVGILYFASLPREFDRKNNIFYKGKGGRKTIIPFADIYALQLIPSYIQSSEGADYYNYQLNLVLHSSQRVNISYYNTLEIARLDMLRISEFIGKKYWDATE